ncbi:MAG: hypothetical protein Q7S03_02940 [bacterium]|nr:hypothetical protein [bacterium]
MAPRPILFFFCFLSFVLFPAKLVSAEQEKMPNNKFGIHLAVVTDQSLEEAASLVNSNGGDWGYVTVVMEKNDKNKEKWQKNFDKMRSLHLIPIVRLATNFENGSWQKPAIEEAGSWVDFLASLNWVVKNRYIVLFNEPNQSKEWGGKVDPEEYGKISLHYAKAFKERDSNFFMMLAGLDAAAPHKPPVYEDEGIFLHQMFASLSNWGEELKGYIDGWASHSYPNHGFIGTPNDWGRNSIRTYIWEKNLLTKYNINPNLPIFITETGWPHSEGIINQSGLYSQSKVESFFLQYFTQLDGDTSIVAITPFVLDYQGEPFDHFSWKKVGGNNEFYPQYQAVQNLSKTKGEPKQEERFAIINSLPSDLTQDSTYQIPVRVRNEGQAIWSPDEGYSLQLFSDYPLEHFFSDFSNLKPFEEEKILFYLKTDNDPVNNNASIYVAKNGKPVTDYFNWAFNVLPTPDINFTVDLFPKIKTEGSDFKIIIYNLRDEVVFEKDDIKVSDGLGAILKAKNLTIGERYRIVLLKPYYLPRQSFTIIKEKGNIIDFGRTFPLDLNKDGKFSFSDFTKGAQKGNEFRSLYWPF